VRERWGCHHDSGRVSFRISNAQRGVERRSLHLNCFRSVTYLLISDSKIGGGCRGKNGSLFLRDKLPCRSVRFVPSGPSHRLAVSRDGDADDVDSFSVAFLGLLDGVLVNALHRDHGIAEIPFEGRFRSVQLVEVLARDLLGAAGDQEEIGQSSVTAVCDTPDVSVSRNNRNFLARVGRLLSSSFVEVSEKVCDAHLHAATDNASRDVKKYGTRRGVADQPGRRDPKSPGRRSH
jgi:hypothetical protein